MTTEQIAEKLAPFFPQTRIGFAKDGVDIVVYIIPDDDLRHHQKGIFCSGAMTSIGHVSQPSRFEKFEVYSSLFERKNNSESLTLKVRIYG